MILTNHPYISLPPLTHDLPTDIIVLLKANACAEVADHVTKVSGICRDLGRKFDLDGDKCTLSGLLHDVSAVIAPDDMLAFALENELPLCRAERKYPALLHGRMSSIIAREYFDITDPDILSAIDCHTTLKAHPSKYDMALFLSDKLSWSTDGTPAFYAAVNSALHTSLEKACYEYMRYMNDSGKIAFPHDNWGAGFEFLSRI